MNRPLLPPLEPTNWHALHWDYLLSFALGSIPEHNTAEDLVQESFLSAWKARDQFRRECTERTWLTSILRNKINDFYRCSSRNPVALAREFEAYRQDDNAAANHPLHRIDHRTPGMEESEPSLVLGEILDWIHACPTLTDIQRRVFLLKELHGYSAKEISELLDLTPQNIWVIVHRVKKRLRSQLIVFLASKEPETK